MKDRCSRCGREIKEGESTFIMLDPKGEWWLHLCDDPICRECHDKGKKPGGDEKVTA